MESRHSSSAPAHGPEPSSSARRDSGCRQGGACYVYVSAVDRRNGGRLLLWPHFPTGTRSASTNHAEAWAGINNCFRRVARDEPLWRSCALDASEIGTVYRALISQLHQISRLARLPDDDAGACIAG